MIRDITCDDHKDVHELLCQLAPTKKFSPEQSQQIIKNMKNNRNSQIIGFEKNFKIIGICLFGKIFGIDHAGRPFGVIESVIVHEKFRKNKIGENIIKYAIKEAEKQDCYKVILETGSDKLWKHKFYEKCGLIKGEKTAFIKTFN